MLGEASMVEYELRERALPLQLITFWVGFILLL